MCRTLRGSRVWCAAALLLGLWGLGGWTVVSRAVLQLATVGMVGMALVACRGPDKDQSFAPFGSREAAQAEAQAVIAEHEAAVRPLERAANLAWWHANTTGADADFAAKEEAQNALDAALSHGARFTRLARLNAVGEGALSGTLARQVQLLYLTYLEKQVRPDLMQAMVAKANAIEQTFNVYRASVNGQAVSDNDILRLLSKSKDSATLQAAWEASKGVGARVAPDLRDLVKLRNEAARALGFTTFHAMQLALNEQSQAEVLALFDQLDTLTRDAYAAVKGDLDARLARRFGLTTAELRPWHYGDLFFQEAPAVYGADADAAYEAVDMVRVARAFYGSIGLDVDAVLENSDLYEKPGKSQHAFCTDIDRNGDVRVLCNLRPSEKWQSTLLHELGHAVYSSRNIPAQLPYLLRAEAHILTTEGIAMMFERFTTQVPWMRAMHIAVPNPTEFERAEAQRKRAQLLIFSRWCQVMYRFEMALYADPSQDLNDLWWQLVERYQGLRRPEGRDDPDYATKIHVVSAPCYYHNYMMGQLFASQLHHAIAREVQHKPANEAIYVGDTGVGTYLQARVFGQGRQLPWNELTVFATGSPLRAEAFAVDFQP